MVVCVLSLIFEPGGASGVCVNGDSAQRGIPQFRAPPSVSHDPSSTQDPAYALSGGGGSYTISTSNASSEAHTLMGPLLPPLSAVLHPHSRITLSPWFPSTVDTPSTQGVPQFPPPPPPPPPWGVVTMGGGGGVQHSTVGTLCG